MHISRTALLIGILLSSTPLVAMQYPSKVLQKTALAALCARNFSSSSSLHIERFNEQLLKPDSLHQHREKLSSLKREIGDQKSKWIAENKIGIACLMGTVLGGSAFSWGAMIDHPELFVPTFISIGGLGRGLWATSDLDKKLKLLRNNLDEAKKEIAFDLLKESHRTHHDFAKQVLVSQDDTWKNRFNFDKKTRRFCAANAWHT